MSGAVAPPTSTEDFDYVPGTLHLVDASYDFNDSHQDKDIILHPTPSSHPDDPLNWNYGRKMLATLCMLVYAMTIAISSAAIYSVIELVSEATDLSVADLNAGTGYMFLSFGWGCLVWQPLGLAYGKRPVYLATTLCTVAIMAWAPFTTNNGQWIANKVLQGFFGAPLESLCEISMADIWFTHERGKYLTLYVLALYIANSIAPLIAGFIAAGQKWEWVLYWCAIYNALSFVFLFFFLEETNWKRDHTASEDTKGTAADSSLAMNRVSEAKSVADNVVAKLEEQAKEDNHPDLEIQTSVQQAEANYTQKTYWSKLKLVSKNNYEKVTIRAILGQVSRPLLYLQFPVVVFCGISVGCYQMWLSFLNGTESTIMTGSYGFSTVMIGVPFVSPIIFAILGYLYAGVFGDRFVVKMSRRNKGVFEPEYRLWLLLPLIVLAPGSQLLWGLGAYYQIQWMGPIIAMGIISFVTVVGAQTCYSYCIDTYRALSGEAIVTVILIRNNMLFGINYGITPWVENMGLRNAYILAACIAFVQVSTFFLMTKFGKRLRAITIKPYRKYCLELEAAGLMH